MKKKINIIFASILNYILSFVLAIIFITPFIFIYSIYEYQNSPRLLEDTIYTIREFSRRPNLAIHVKNITPSILGSFRMDNILIGIPYATPTVDSDKRISYINKFFTVPVESLEYTPEINIFKSKLIHKFKINIDNKFTIIASNQSSLKKYLISLFSSRVYKWEEGVWNTNIKNMPTTYLFNILIPAFFPTLKNKTISKQIKGNISLNFVYNNQAKVSTKAIIDLNKFSFDTKDFKNIYISPFKTILHNKDDNFSVPTLNIMSSIGEIKININGYFTPLKEGTLLLPEYYTNKIPNFEIALSFNNYSEIHNLVKNSFNCPKRSLHYKLLGQSFALKCL
jgi:hypothetical protein